MSLVDEFRKSTSRGVRRMVRIPKAFSHLTSLGFFEVFDYFSWTMRSTAPISCFEIDENVSNCDLERQ